MAENPGPEITRNGLRDYTIRGSQHVALSVFEAFSFFEDPRNLARITPPWLRFRIVSDCGGVLCRGAEYDYTIRWFGLPMPWRTRITEYTPGVSFTDTQIRGPYRSWVHRHTFLEERDGTLVRDRVDFSLFLTALPLGGVIRRQLEGIFSYRARRITEWADGAAPRVDT